MKEERMAILSMVEKGVITVEEAERLFAAIDKKGTMEISSKLGDLFSKANDSISVVAKKVGDKTEQLVEDAKPVMQKASEKLDKIVEDTKPVVKKAGEKINEKTDDIKKAYYSKKNEYEVEDCDFAEEVEESDFVEEVTIIPVKECEEEVAEEVVEEVVDEEEKIEE